MLNNRTPTEKQIEAARANGKKSRGPVTPQGKFNSAHSRSSLGPLARTVVLDGESAERFGELVDALHAELLPESPVEIQLVESMAVARWRQMRFWALEKATIAAEVAKARGPAATFGPARPDPANLDPASSFTSAPASGSPPIDLTVIACNALVNGSPWTEHMSRTENRHDRLYNRAMTLFHKHRAWRREELKISAAIPEMH
ncbi:MAG: hypothetical protein ABJC09_03640 [Terriglobia bacterium]